MREEIHVQIWPPGLLSPLWPTTYIAIVPRLTGILSAISSSLIIFLIFRSASRISTIYHRIMFAMSVFDIMGSLAISFTSILMPKEMPLEQDLGLLSWPGARYGNTFTCNVQGFLATFGPACMTGYNIALCQYYAFAIALRMKEENIRKYVQPVILILPLIVGFAIAAPPLFYELYNPPIHLGAAWCIATTYPTFNCQDDTCIRGKRSMNDLMSTLLKRISIVGALIVAVSLALVVCTVCFRPPETIKISGYKDECGLDKDNVGAHHAVPSADDVINAGMGSIPLEEDFDIGSNTTPSIDVSRALSSSKDDRYLESDPKRGHYDLQALRMKPEGEPPDELDDIFYEIESAAYHVNGSTYNRNLRKSPTRRRHNQRRGVSHNDSLSSVEEDSDTSLETDEQSEEARVRTDPRVVAMQATAYLAAYVMTALWIVFLSNGESVQMWAFKTSLFLFPLHGFFNLIIFLCHKVYNYRRIHTDESICSVLKLLFRTPLQEPCFITRISVVEKYEVANAFLVSNEMGDRTIIRKSALEHSEPSESSPGFLLELQSGESFVEDSCNKENFSVTSNFSPCILSSYVYCNRPSE